MKILKIVIMLFCVAGVFSEPTEAADVKKALEVVFGHEGGLQCDRDDPGNWSGGKVGAGKQGCTKFGIATNSYPNLDIRHLTIAQAATIYEQDYWKPLRLSQFKSQGLATEIFDTAVNCGVGTAARIVSRCCNHLNGRGADFPVTSKITDETIWWLNEYTRTKSNRVRFYKLLNGYQLGRYIDIANKNPKMDRYLVSWLSRVNW